MKTSSTANPQLWRWLLLAALGLWTGIVRAQNCVGTNPGGAAAGGGLYAEYYAGFFADDFSFFSRSPNLTRVDGQLNFATDDSWGDLTGFAAGSVTDPDNFSARFRGSLYLAAAGTYTFYLTSDDGSYLWLDGAALASPLTAAAAAINNGGSRSVQTVAATLTLNAGQHNVLVLYGEGAGGNTLQLEYENAALGIARQAIPASLFCTATQPAAPQPATLRYTPSTMRLTAGSNGVSVAPIVSGASTVTGYALVNTAALPAGITLDEATGQVQASGSVPLGRYLLTVSARSAGGTTVFNRAFTLVVAPPPPVGCGRLNPDGSLASSGLYTEYFAGYFNDDISFFTSQPVAFTRTENELNFDSADSWGDLTGAATGPADNPDSFSARFRGRIAIPATGTYTLYLTSDDASLLWIDGAALAPTLSNVLIDNRGSHAPTTLTAQVPLAAGLHDVLVLYGDYVGVNVLRLEFSSSDANVARQIVSVDGLCSSRSDAPLPVALTRFTAQPAAAGVAVAWETAQELNSAYFVVERSANGKVFEAVQQLNAAGTTNQHQTYALTDRTPLRGQSYYRLRQVDTDGTVHYSSVAPVQWAGSAEAALAAVVFPNPTAGDFTVQVRQAVEQPVRLQVLDMRGRALLTAALTGAATQEYTVKSGQLPRGVYLLRLTTSAAAVTQKLIVE